MAATPPRRSGRAARLQRVAHRPTRTPSRPAAAPIGSRPPGRRRRTAGPASPVTRQPAAATPVVAAPTDRWTRVQQAAGTLAALGTLAVIVFTWLSLQQVDNEHALTREGQVTDRYNAAVGNIGDDALEVRLGGIYALQRIMEDSPRDQPSIINVLSTYVRNHAKKPKQGTDGPKEPPSDVQAALTALGSRNPDHDGTARIHLRDAYLPGADLTDADLTGANLPGADLTGADLTGARLYHANLRVADLTGAKQLP
ncbi:pentapeptide repeat-containing protein [Streptomyces albogriseolus]|uniref:pentapeptide repeat-containing protein n=1 Tax=Streptomyces albogriseolus TaxID=1887 RepID=UPI003CF4A8FE